MRFSHTNSGGRRPSRPLAVVLALLVATTLAVATGPSAAERSEPAGDQAPAAIDGSNSAAASRLLDGVVGETDAVSWANAGNRWQADAYPMVADIDLGQAMTVGGIRYYGGEIPFPSQAALQVEYSPTGSAGSFLPLTVVTSPVYGRWSAPIGGDEVTASVIRLRFDSMPARFNIAEVEIDAEPTGGAVGPNPGPGRTEIRPVAVADGTNSINAARLADRVEPPGTGDGASWLNPNPWHSSAYPMTAVFDLGARQRLDAIEYFVGNISPGTDRVVLEVSTAASGDGFEPLATITDGHTWGTWRRVPLDGVEARRVRIRFDDRYERFNISELRFFGQPAAVTTTSTTAPTTTTTQQPTTTEPPTTPEPPTTTEPPITVPPQTGDQPKAGPPPADVVRSHGFGTWPGDHLTQSCRDLHDSYWVRGPEAGTSTDPNHPENRAYHTWHPTVAVDPMTGERCDFGHEHGFNPTFAPAELFELSGGWPAFGYVAETMGGHRHEDHVGHKVTVARFRASIGNAAGPDPLYDAGFECDWLSKVHQGSHSLDAFANHLHEYYLTLRCFDGLNGAGVVDNTVVGTELSIKVMYTYGRPNEFTEDGCSRDDPATARNETSFPASILTGPEGQPVPIAHQTAPLGNDSPNNRGFTCSSGVLWKDVSEIQNVDLWTQLIKIERNDGSTAMTVQPYYIVKNPARIVEAYDGGAGERPSRVIRTIDLCYDEAGNRLQRPFCNGAPDAPTDWRSPDSPFNGTLRAVNFKASHLANAGGDERFCTDPFGFATDDRPPCRQGNVLQRASRFDNHWNDGRYRYGGRGGNIQGSIWAEDPYGRRFEATPTGGGAYRPNGVGFEFIIDNRDPDDDRDGNPDGANIRGEN